MDQIPQCLKVVIWVSHHIGVDMDAYHRFQIDYLDLNQVHINFNYNMKINNIISLSGISNYFKWDKEVYYKPNLTVDINTPINLRDKIKVTPSLSYIGERKSVNYFASESANTISQFSPLFHKLPAQIHANLGLYYSYSKQLDFHLELNNITNSKEDIWHGYRELGFNAVFGLNYRF